MKFGKELTTQMVPEWQEAYMDYEYLKMVLKDVHHFKQRNKPSSAINPSGLTRKLTLYRAFSGLTVLQRSPTTNDHEDIESHPILVSTVKKSDGEEGYQTRFLMTAEEGGEYELVFFRRLDDEFNKVVRFYRAKVEEVMKEAAVLNTQMDALIAFRIKVDKPQHSWFHSTVDMTSTRIASAVAASAAALSTSKSSGIRGVSRRVPRMDIIEEDRSVRRVQSDISSSSYVKQAEPSNLSVQQLSSSRPVINNTREINRPAPLEILERGEINRPAQLEILERVTINKPVETPRSTIKGFLNVPIQTELKFSKENLNKVEDQLKRAFIEFYHKLRLLKSYSFLNILAFSKIMKKYDKITSRDASKSYMNMVDNSYLGSSDEVTKLMDRVEVAFIKHFSNSNRKKGLSTLRPKPKRDTHAVTASVGFLAGCTVALIIALALIIRTRHILEKDGAPKYMETMFPLYSLFAFVVLHMLMYAGNIYFWRRYRVNYPFIFGFKAATALGYREVLLLSFGLAVLALGSVMANLDMEMDPETGDYKAITELLPLGLVVLVVVIVICPFNIIYRSSRFFLLTCLFHCVCAPLYKVALSDFILADQLTSQVQAFRSLEFYICYYTSADYKHRENNCNINDVYNAFNFIVAAIPFWFRLLQCLRRFVEEKDGMQGWNALKYFSIIVAVTTRTAYTRSESNEWKIIAWIASGIAAIGSTYWDLVLDWGLLQRNSSNPWLRDKLLVPHKSVYFAAMVLNVLLRLAWVQTVLDFEVSFLHKESLITIVASLEIIRRGVWNFFRLENEHLYNVGKYRAFKSVPLPFNYDEDDDEDKD